MFVSVGILKISPASFNPGPLKNRECKIYQDFVSIGI